AEERVSQVLEACPAPIQMSVADSGEILYRSPATAELFGEPDTAKSYYVNPVERENYLKELRNREAVAAEYLESRIDHFRRPDTIKTYLAAVSDTRTMDRRTLNNYIAGRKLLPEVLASWKATLEDDRFIDIFGPWRKMKTEKPLNPLVQQALDKNGKDLIQMYGNLLGSVNRTKPFEDPNREALRQVVFSQQLPLKIPHQQRERLLGNRKNREEYRKKIREVHKHIVDAEGSPPRGMVLLDKAKAVEPYIFLRGNQHSRGDQVPRKFPSLFKEIGQQPFKEGSGRLDLARAIVDPKNPLTARVLVNRVWTQLLGRGFVNTPSDFGVRCEPPSHPDLLDHLATTFMREGWSVKKLHRSILLSATWQQGLNPETIYLETDPIVGNFWQMNVQRLELEALRDSMLWTADRLDLTMGGKSVKLETQPFSRRRAVYGYIERQNLPNLFRTFDFANPDTHTPKRHFTTMPQQALFMMNGPFVLEQAAALVKLPAFVKRTEVDDRIRFLYRKVLGRNPEPDDVATARSFVAGEEDWRAFAQVLLCSNEFMFVD
ncbi:MAG: DUF1553 domain-containing protein, partial [Verrucomicrobiota bacterium]